MTLTYLALQTTFQLRVKAYNSWQSAQTTLAKKRENEVKLQTAGKPEKIAQAKAEIEDVSLDKWWRLGLDRIVDVMCVVVGEEGG